MSAHTSEKPANLEKLIAIEWEILDDLKKLLVDPELSMAEKIRACNALAYHVSVLNKLLAQKGEGSEFDDATLGDFIRGVEARIARRVKVDLGDGREGFR